MRWIQLINQLTLERLNQLKRAISEDQIWLKFSIPLLIILTNNENLAVIEGKNSKAIVLNYKSQLNQEKRDQIYKNNRKVRHIIIQFELDKLADKSNAELSHLLRTIMRSLVELNTLLRSRLKITLELTNLEKFHGFTEFFDKANISFGIESHFTHIRSTEFYPKLEQAYSKLIQTIKQESLIRIYQSHDMKTNHKLYLFSEFLETHAAKMLFIVKELLKPNHIKRKVSLHGIYFNGEKSTQSSSSSYLKPQSICRQALNIVTQQSNLSYAFHKLNLIPYLCFSFIACSLSLSTITLIKMRHEYVSQLQFSKEALRLVDAIKLNETNPANDPLLLVKLIVENSIISSNPTHQLRLIPYSYTLENRIHQLINPRFSNLLFKLMPTYLAEKLHDTGLAMPEHWMASLAYLSLSKPKQQHYLSDALCFFWLLEAKRFSAASCQQLPQWINPKLSTIKQDIIATSRERLLENDLAERVFAHFYAQSRINPEDSIALDKSFANLKSLITDEDASHHLFKPFTRTYSLNMNALLDSYSQDANFLGLEEDLSELWFKEQNERFQQIFRQSVLKYWQQRLAQIHIKNFQSIFDLENLSSMLGKNRSNLQKLLKLINQYQPEWLNQTQAELDYFDYSKVADWLKSISRKLNTIKQTNNSGAAAFELMKSVQEAETNTEFSAIIQISKSAPYPLSQWLTEIYQNAWYLLAQIYIKHVNAEWQNTILPFYNETIKDHYPLAQSDSELSLNDFQYFFGPGQLLDNFFKEHLALFFTLNANGLTLKSQAGLKLAIAKSSLDFLNSLVFIQQNYFDANTSLPRVEFSIEPVELSRETRRLQLSLGASQLSYQHGPQYTHKVTWPSIEYNESSLRLLSFSAHTDEISIRGEWSLFRLFDAAVRNNPSSNQLQLDYEFPKQNCSFVIKHLSDPSILTLLKLKNLKFPAQLLSSNQPAGDIDDPSPP